MPWQHWDEGGGDPEEPERLAAGARPPAGPQPPVLTAPPGPQPQPAGGVDFPQRGLLSGQTTLRLNASTFMRRNVFLRVCHCPVSMCVVIHTHCPTLAKGFTQPTPYLSKAQPCTVSYFDRLFLLPVFPAHGWQTWKILIIILSTQGFVFTLSLQCFLQDICPGKQLHLHPLPPSSV